MKDKRILGMLIILLMLEFITPFFSNENVTHAASTPPKPSHLGNKNASFNHFIDDENGWAKQGNGNFLQLGGFFIRADVNQLRANWHADLAEGVKLGGVEFDSEDAYTAPEGYKIHSIASYAVYRMRTYMVQKEKSGCAGGLPTDNQCNPYYFKGDAGEKNDWAKPPNIRLPNHWVYYGPDTWEINPGLGEKMQYYNWRTAQIRKTGDQNGAGGSPLLKYDFKIVPDGTTEPGPGPEGECSIDISPPSPGGSIQADSFDAGATGVIKADYRGNEMFDVLQGIPTSESLYANAFAREYLFKHVFTNMTGKVTVNIKLKKEFELKWVENKVPKSETVVIEKDVQVYRPYSYWQIDNLEVYGLEYAEMMNYALPGEYVMMNPAGGYNPPNVDANNSDNVEDHVFPPACPKISVKKEVIDGKDKKPTPPTDFPVPDVESQVGDVKVKNDLVNFNGQTIMSDVEATETAPTPSQIPEAPMTGSDVFYEYGLMISSSKVNRANTPSSGNIYYNQIIGIKGGQGQLLYPIVGINTVTVHTPVVIYANVSDDAEHNQRTEPDYSRQAVILERPFTVYTPTTGQHRNIPGYGNRDYAKYTRSKEVKFPFDVFKYEYGNKGTFYPANTWIDIPIPQLETDFFMPVWVDEGAYNVEFRTIAENAPYDYTTQSNANLDLTHHAATDSIPIDVIGRVYDFRVTDIGDYAWEAVFRLRKGHFRPSGNHYWVQDRGIDGDVRGNQFPYVLPIMPGSHPTYQNIAVKTGYHFKFDLKTKGNMFSEGDGVRITPTFYFVDKQGNNRQEVDLYYKANNNFVKIGGPDDQERRYVILNERLRNVPQDHILNAAEYAFDHYPNVETTIKNRYLQNYLEESKKKTWVGKFDWMILPYKVKTHIGPKEIPFNASVNQVRANASIQQWYGEYSLPAAVYTVKKGTNLAEYGRLTGLTDKSPIFLKDGYILVNFNIETIRNQKIEQPHLQYIYAPLTNQWKREGYQYNRKDPYGNSFDFLDGDVIFYHGDLSSYDDFKSNVTH